MNDHPQAKLLKFFQYPLPDKRIGIWTCELPDNYQQKLGEDVWKELESNIILQESDNCKEELLDELELNDEQLKQVFKLADHRPILLALFMDWFSFSFGKQEPATLLKEIQQIRDEKLRKEAFRRSLVQHIEHDYQKRILICRMAVGYHRMTAKIMSRLLEENDSVKYSLEYCQKILKQLRPLSFVKYKKCDDSSDVILLHDEMLEMIEEHSDDLAGEHANIAKKLVEYYDKEFLSPNYQLTSESRRRLQKQAVPEEIISKLNELSKLFCEKEAFCSALQEKLKQNELKEYKQILIAAARQNVSQEEREVYTPELIEYAFMMHPDEGVRRFCEEFDIAMEDGRFSYAGRLLQETKLWCIKYGASLDSELEVYLREAQYYIDSNKRNISRALDIIISAHKKKYTDSSWKDSVLYGKFKLWEGIAYFWLNKFDKAVPLLEEARDVFTIYKEERLQLFRANNWIGYNLYRKSNFNKAEVSMLRTIRGLLDLLEENKDHRNMTRRNIEQYIQYSLGNLAILYRYTGKFVKSVRYAEIACDIVKGLKRNNKEILRSLHTLGHVLAIAGRNMDARFYLDQAIEKIYGTKDINNIKKDAEKYIDDPLLEGRLYSSLCQLSYGTMEFANLLECYRAEELHRAVENSHGKNVQEYIEYAEKAIQCLGQKPIFHKELADAYFSLGELYMMMPANHPYIQKKGDKWKLAEQAFEKALDSAQTSKFQYRVVDTLESLVTLYYFQSQADGSTAEQKETCNDKIKEYKDAIRKNGNIENYPNLAGRYELIKGDIHFDKALDLLKAEYPKADKGLDDLLKAFDHYIKSADYKKEFNINRYYLMLLVIYNRLDKLVELAHPLKFSRLEFLDYEQKEESRKEPLISQKALSQLAQKRAEWTSKVEDFRSFKEIFKNVLLLRKKKISKKKLEALEEKLKEHKKSGAYWEAVLVNKCLTELHWIQAHLSKDTEEKETYIENVVLHLNRHSRQYRLMGDSFHAKRSYERAEKIISDPEKITSNLRLKKALEGYTEIVKGEYFLQRVEFATLLESLVVGELEAGRKKFEEQFPNSLDNARKSFNDGIKWLEDALKDACWNNQSLSKQEYENKLSEAYFMLGELFILHEQHIFSNALDCFEKCMGQCKCLENKDDCRLDDAQQSYLSVFYFSSGNCGSKERCQEYEQELEQKIQAKDYSRPWVAARFRSTQGDMLFSKCYEIDESVNSDFLCEFKQRKEKKKVEREDIVQMFRKYIEACNYKAGYNELSFESGLRILRRRIEMIPDSESLDMLLDEKDGLPAFWNASNHLKEKEELDSILQLIRMRSLILQYEEQ